MVVLYAWLIAALFFGGTRLRDRMILLIAAVPVSIVFLDAERRAAVVGLVVAGGFIGLMLMARNRSRFMKVFPVLFLLTAVYTAAFWNNESQLGFPAQAIKIIVQPDSSTEADASSNLYRDIENLNLNATIRSNPVLGVGFGQPFLQPIPLPDISFFEFWLYIPHNSILWVWTKVGFVGFVAFLMSFSLAISNGMRAVARIPTNRDAAMMAALVSYIPATFVFAFVDISFDGQTVALLAFAFAAATNTERLLGLPEHESKREQAQRLKAEKRSAAKLSARERARAGARI
jgi:O-antigen ligase